MCKKISIIIPCYNTEKYIDRCLTSLISQTIGLEYLSIICVNDASTDKTWQKLEKWKERYPNNFILINCIENGKQGSARNIALSYVTTPYTGYMDSDDWAEPDMYEKMYQRAESLHCDIVSCGIIRDPASSPVTLHQHKPASWLITINSIQERKSLIVNNTIKYSACDKLIRTDFLNGHGISFPEKLAYEDLYWGCMLYLYANTICIMEDKFYHYFINPDATVLATDRPYHKDILQINQLRWEMYSSRNVLDIYRSELEYDFLVSGYLSALKILSLRFTTDTWQDYRRLYEHTIACVPDFTANPYRSLFSDFQKLQLQMLENPLSHKEWQDYCSFIKTHSTMK